MDARYINGPAWGIQLYLPWIDGFVARSEPWAKRRGPSRSISRRDIALRGKTANGQSLTCRPRDNRIAGNYCRLSGFNIEGLISAKELRNSTRRTWKVLHDLQGFQLAPHCATGFARVIPGLDQINRLRLCDNTMRPGKHIVADDLPPERSWKVADSVYVFSWTVFTLRASSSASSTST